ncbi:MAG: Dps family protein [Gammaproteobacteria bacterium]
MAINISINEADRKAVADGLSALLANSYTLYLKTHNYHWNVTGHMFPELHTLFEKQYQDLAMAVDDIAERIRALGFKAPGSYSAFTKLGTIQEETGSPNALKMIEQLVKDHETIIREAHALFEVANKVNDEATADLLTTRMGVHEKNAWMLRSLLEE